MDKCKLHEELLNSRMSYLAQKVSKLQILRRVLRNDHKMFLLTITFSIYSLLAVRIYYLLSETGYWTKLILQV